MGTKIYSRYNKLELNLLKAAGLITKLEDGTFQKAAALHEASRILKMVEDRCKQEQEQEQNKEEESS